MRIASAWSPAPAPTLFRDFGKNKSFPVKRKRIIIATGLRPHKQLGFYNSRLAVSLCQGSLYPELLWLIAQLLIEDSALSFQGRKERGKKISGVYCSLSMRWVSRGATARLLRRWMTTSGSFRLESSRARVGLKQQGNELHTHLCCWIGPEWSRKSLKGHSCCSRRFPLAVKRT